MDRQVYTILSANIGRTAHRQLPVHRVETYEFEQAMDIDTDGFSIAIGDHDSKYAFLLDRDTEVRAAVYLKDTRGRFHAMFTGISDSIAKSSDDMTLNITGRDLSSLALGDAPPGKWKHVRPKQFITNRAHNVGLPNILIHEMREFATLVSDGSETEWAFWYRMAREREMWMWTEPNGKLMIDKLGYSLAPSYRFGQPPRGVSSAGWIMPERVAVTKSTTDRVGDVWVYGQDAKTSIPFVTRGIDTTIKGWKRKPLRIMASSTAKSVSEAKKEADLEVFESIVGAFEIELTIHDVGTLVLQNRMARVELPDFDLSGNFFIVGVRSVGSGDGMTQVLRLRQKGFAMSKRVPSDPKLVDSDVGKNAVSASIGAQLATLGRGMGVQWADSFVRATREFGTANGWDTAVFLGVLLAICEHESSFRNVRRGGDTEWMSLSAWMGRDDQLRRSGAGLDRGIEGRLYEETFANEPNYAVGPMQLLSQSYKDWADQYGWNGKPTPGELEGGRWNPDSNIRAAARALIEKLNTPPRANPTKADDIWIGVRRYYGSTDESKNEQYMRAVRALYNTRFKELAKNATTTSSKLVAGSTATKIQVPGHGEYQAPTAAPDAVKKAINFCLRHLGDRYQWAGSGPYYDCSSLVTAALASASTALHATLDEPYPGHHGESTYTLYKKGRAIKRDELLAGDLVFFNNLDHVGMYLGEGLMIHDPHTGDVVKISALTGWYSENYVGARRFIEWPFRPFD